MTRVNNKLKLLIMLGIVLLSILVFGTSKVEATTYTDKDKKVIVDINGDLGISGTQASCTVNEYMSEGEGKSISNTIYITGVNQKALDEYANSPKTIKSNIKVKLPSNDIKKAIWTPYDENGNIIDGDEIEIVTIDGNKYISYSYDFKYNNVPYGKPVDNSVKYIVLHNGDGAYTSNKHLKFIKDNNEVEKYNVFTEITVNSENQPFEYGISYVNKYGKKYPTIGGMGSGPDGEDKWYLTSKADVEGMFGFGSLIYALPTKTNLAEAYFKLDINVYQGEKIDVEDFGTLYYAGIEEETEYDVLNNKTITTKNYIYKNSLNNLKQLSKTVTFKAKGENGYTYTRGISYGYELNDEWSQEETITGTINTENKDTKIKMNIVGNGNAKFKSIELQKNDTLYVKLEKGLQEVVSDKYTYLDLGTFDISVVEGAYNGKLKLTFDVGTKYNGKECIVGHLANGLNYESFKAKVVDGKVTIEVDSLSPFMIAMVEEKQSSTQKPSTNKPTETPKQDETNPTTDKPHIKDETPKTGAENNIVATITSILSLVSVVGIAVIKKF